MKNKLGPDGRGALNVFHRVRCHHLLKTFWAGANGWRDEQLRDGTVIWTAPTGQ
jgi:hypothetical protein